MVLRSRQSARVSNRDALSRLGADLLGRVRRVAGEAGAYEDHRGVRRFRKN